jgi:hypothetical protein
VFKVTVPRRFGGYEMFIPMSELLIKETWFVAGMKGTGSNTIIADKVFVPEHRLRSVPQALQNEYATEHTDEALYRSSFIPVLTLILAGPQLGLGRAALRFVTDKAPKRGIAYTKFERQIDSTAFQFADRQCGNADRHRPPACLLGRRRHRRRRGGGREAQLSQPGTGAG